MKCTTCGKEIQEKDFMLVKGIGITCYDCYTAISEKRANYVAETPKFSVFLYVVTGLIFVGGFIGGIILGNQLGDSVRDQFGLSIGKTFNTPAMLCAWLSALVVGSIISGIGKIIELLQKIENK